MYGDRDGVFPRMAEFKFDVPTMKLVLRRLGKRNSAPGVSGATYGGVAAAIRSEPGVAGALVEQIETVRVHLRDHTDFLAGVLPKVWPSIWLRRLNLVCISMVPKRDPRSFRHIDTSLKDRKHGKRQGHGVDSQATEQAET